MSDSMPPRGSAIARIASARLPGTARIFFGNESRAQNIASLHLNRTPVLGGAPMEPAPKVFIRIFDGNAGHGAKLRFRSAEG